MSQTTQRSQTQRPKTQRPKTKKKKQQRPKKVQPTYVSITKPIKPRPMVMNPVTLRTTTRRTPAVSSTLSPETIMMNEMRKVIMEKSPPRPIQRSDEDGLGILDLFPDMILTTTPRSEDTTATTRPIRFPQNNNPRQSISSARQIGNEIAHYDRTWLILRYILIQINGSIR